MRVRGWQRLGVAQRVLDSPCYYPQRRYPCDFPKAVANTPIIINIGGSDHSAGYHSPRERSEGLNDYYSERYYKMESCTSYKGLSQNLKLMSPGPPLPLHFLSLLFFTQYVFHLMDTMCCRPWVCHINIDLSQIVHITQHLVRLVSVTNDNTTRDLEHYAIRSTVQKHISIVYHAPFSIAIVVFQLCLGRM